MSDTDRELLELAAKAADLKLAYMPFSHTRGDGVLTAEGNLWNPLTRSDDALWLAVKLRMELSVIEDRASAQASAPHGSPWCAENTGSDPYAATRRAIVRAAAEIGRDMP